MKIVDGLNQITGKYIEKINNDENSLKCGFKDICGFDKITQHCHGPLIGSEKSEILIVAESPAGTGVTFGKMFKDVEKKGKNKNFLALRGFISKINNDNIPHFTDVVKCGVGKLKGKVKYDLLSIRFNNCKKYLYDEINIISPKLIITVGWFATKKVKELIKENNINVKHLEILHFSDNGKMNITVEDKTEIIWPLQLKTFFSDIKLKSENILDLNYFRLRRTNK